jgi:hypothetical protein
VATTVRWARACTGGSVAAGAGQDRGGGPSAGRMTRARHTSSPACRVCVGPLTLSCVPLAAAVSARPPPPRFWPRVGRACRLPVGRTLGARAVPVQPFRAPSRRQGLPGGPWRGQRGSVGPEESRVVWERDVHRPHEPAARERHLGVGGLARARPDDGGPPPACAQRRGRMGPDDGASSGACLRPVGLMRSVSTLACPCPTLHFGGQAKPGRFTFNVIAPR